MTDHSPDTDKIIETAIQFQRAGKLDDAETLYRDILDHTPEHAEVLHFLGLVQHQKGQHGDAVELIQKAIALEPGVVQFKFNLGLVQSAAELYENASITFKSILDSGQNAPDLVNAYALALKNSHRLSEAETVLTKLKADHPTFAAGHFNLGNIYLEQGRGSDAVIAFEAALNLQENADIYRNLAAALQSIGHSQRAISILETLLQSSPDDVASLNNLSNLYRENGDLEQAESLLVRALDRAPTLADAWYNLGAIKTAQNATSEGKNAYDKAIKYRPGFVKAEWASTLALPQIYQSEAQRTDSRAHWRLGLKRITESPLPKTLNQIQASMAAISEITPFALAYQGEDDRDLMSTWGDHISAIVQTAHPTFSTPLTPPPRVRKRVVFVSAHFRSHTIERLFSNWITGLNADEFDVQLVSTSGGGDTRTTELCAQVSGAFTMSTSTHEIAAHLHGLSADIIVYPDIGMDPRTQVLAALPLAQHQVMAWGHPVTSGLPTIGTFISSALMEPSGSADQYREKLVTLPNLSISYPRPPKTSISIPHDFLCAQALFKIPPHQDQAFAEILSQAPGASLSFFSHPISGVTEAFRKRISDALKNYGLEPSDSLTFIPPCNRQTFLNHLAGAKVILDTFEWSGGNTSLESFAMGTPVVTLPGRFMRGRHTYAMLKLMDIQSLIAIDLDDYIQTASSLWNDATHRIDITNLIEERSDCLFGDQEPIRELAAFLRDL